VTEQKQIEMALRQSEARLKGFLDHAPMLMYLKDTEGRFLLVNREFERIDASTGPTAIPPSAAGRRSSIRRRSAAPLMPMTARSFSKASR
jgi:hypothetical protein